MQEIIFANDQRIQAEEVRGGYMSGRDTLTFVFPEDTPLTFEQLKQIFLNNDITSTITVIYQEKAENETVSALRQNVQVGYVVPMSLAFENGKYNMTLGKLTQQEAEFREIKERMKVLEALLRK